MTFTIPDTVLAETKISSDELRIELAVYLYENSDLALARLVKWQA